MSNIIHYLFVIIHVNPVKKSKIFILKYYYVGFISTCNGIIGTDAIELPLLFTDCAKVIGSSGASSYLGGN